MAAERLFDVVFAGRPLQGVPLGKAVNALAGLSRKLPQEITALFNDRPTVLKRGVPQKTALQYREILENAGLSCFITVTGNTAHPDRPKGSSGHGNSSIPPPAHPAYSAHFTSPAVQEQKGTASPHGTESIHKHRFIFPDLGSLINLASLSFLLPEILELETAPADLGPATIGQRIWAALSTFCHMCFMFIIMQIPVGIAAGLYLLFSDAALSPNFISSLRGVAGLLGMASAFLVLPLLWRGHSFGQRAMGILVVPRSDDDGEDLSGPAMLLRRLTWRTRSACAVPVTPRPWNKALLPFAAAIILNFALSLPLAGLLKMTGGFDISSPQQTSLPSQMTREAATSFVTQAEHLLRQTDIAMRTSSAEFDMASAPLTPTVFTEILGRYLPPGMTSSLLAKLNDGSMQLQGDLSAYRIGIKENDQWIVLNERGYITHEKIFDTGQ